jgi:hypothetical protein
LAQHVRKRGLAGTALVADDADDLCHRDSLPLVQFSGKDFSSWFNVSAKAVAASYAIMSPLQLGNLRRDG